MDILVVLHFFALIMGGAAAFGLPVIGAIAGSSPPEHAASIARAVKPLKVIGHTAIAVLLVTGAILATRNGIWSDAPPAFWIKLGFVALLIAGIVVGGKAGAAAMKGVEGAAAKARAISAGNLVSLLIIVLLAVVAFH